MKKRVLHLTLKRIYFDQIAHGIKKEEYREIKSYWIRRLYNKWLYIRTFDEIHFTNGYGKDKPFMRIKCKGIIQEQDRFVIKLGKILEFKNYEWVV